jgi:DNA replicative helicase MCM subunit Mcm2 (Cdc46/Mcm family)
VSATPRQLESLIRLSESLARMELQHTVLERHVQEAIRLMKVSMQQSAMDQRTGMIDMDKIFSGVGAIDRETRKHLAVMISELLVRTLPYSILLVACVNLSSMFLSYAGKGLLLECTQVALDHASLHEREVAVQRRAGRCLCLRSPTR